MSRRGSHADVHFRQIVLRTPVAQIVRFAVEQGGTIWWTIAVKCPCLFALIMLLLVAQHGCKLREGFMAGPAHIGLVAVLQCFVTLGFPIMFQTTTAAKSMLMVSINPLIAALLGWRILGDKPSGDHDG